MYPRQSSTTHTEQLGDEASVYDWARGQVHALNPTAARVWRLCDGATSLKQLLRPCAWRWIPEAEAVVDLTLRAARARCTCWNCRLTRAAIDRRRPGAGCSVVA